MMFMVLGGEFKYRKMKMMRLFGDLGFFLDLRLFFIDILALVKSKLIGYEGNKQD